MIGLGENLNCIYILVVNVDSSKSSSFHCFNKNVSTVCNNFAQSNSLVIPRSALWHFRLGHLSHQRLSQMQSLYPYISCNNKDVSDICHLAKQKKLPFSPSLSIASSKSELLHFNIWGPLAFLSIHDHKYFLTVIDDFSIFFIIIEINGIHDAMDYAKFCNELLDLNIFLRCILGINILSINCIINDCTLL